MHKAIEVSPITRLDHTPIPFLRVVASDDYIKALEQRMASRRETIRSNCIGTALFMASEIRHDVYYSVKTVYKGYLKKYLRQVPGPAPGCLVAWVSTKDRSEVKHMGIITGMDPLSMAHRIGMRDRFAENVAFKDANIYYGLYFRRVCAVAEFYLPQGFTNYAKAPGK